MKMASATGKLSTVMKKRSHKVLPISRKLELLKKLEAGVGRKKLMEEYNVSSSTIYDIKKQNCELYKFASKDLSGSSIERKVMKKPKLCELDEVLYKWFVVQRSEGKPVSGPLIIEKAKMFYESMQITEPCAFSDGWLRNFKQRHGIRQLDISGETCSADADAAERYSATFSKLVNDHGLLPCQIYNADETGLFYRSLPERTLAGAGEKSAKGFKRNKERLTVLTCANASGTHKLKLLVIGKYKNPRALKNVRHLPVWYDSQGNAWMTAEIFHRWFHNYFVPAVKANLGKEGLPADSKVVLLLDNCRAHPPASQLVNGNIFVVYLPPNVTSLIQPMDQGVIQKFKSAYRASFARNMLNTTQAVTEFQKSFNIRDAMFMAAMAWGDVAKSTLQRCWRKLWPGAMFQDNEEDEEMFDGFGDKRSSEFRSLLKVVEGAPKTNVLSKLTETDIAEWVEENAPITNEPTDHQLILSVTQPEALEPTKDSDDDEEEEEKQENVSWAEAEKSLRTFLRFAEGSSHFSAAEVMNLHLQYREFQTKRTASLKQVTLYDMFKKAAKRASSGASPSQSSSTSPASSIASEPVEDLNLEEEVDDPEASTAYSFSQQ